MMVSTKGRYALRVLVDMAEHENGGYIPLREIAERQDVSEKYLESIVKALVKGGILIGLRGKGGGYRLQKAPEDVTVIEVLDLTENSMAPVSCLEKGAEVCARSAECRTLNMWAGLNKVISDYLSGFTIKDLMWHNCGDITDHL